MGSLLLKGLLGVVLSTVTLEIPSLDPSYGGSLIPFWLFLSLIWGKSYAPIKAQCSPLLSRISV